MQASTDNVIPFPGGPQRRSRYAGRTFLLSPSSPAPLFSCRGLRVSRSAPVAVAGPDADDFAIAEALRNGLIAEFGASGLISADVVMTPVVSEPLEPAGQPAPPRLETYPGFGREERYLIRRSPWWMRLWKAVRDPLAALLDRLAEFRFRRKMARYRRNIHKVLES